MSISKKSEFRILPMGPRRPDAVFIGWQPIRSGEPIALYNITAAGHPSNGSTVTDKTLMKLNLQIPGTPPPDENTKKE
jgi:hypothetical protein